MPVVEIYTKPLCPFCIRAKRLLEQKGVAFDEIDIWLSSARKSEMMERAEGRYTVPQIFIDGRGIGGCDDLMALDAAGELDPLLNGGALENGGAEA
jgi:glutaredoxin 3